MVPGQVILLTHLIGVLLIEFVLNFIAVLLVKLIRWYLYQVGERCLTMSMIRCDTAVTRPGLDLLE